MSSIFKLITLGTLGLAVAACDDVYDPIVDGPRNIQFQSDLDACRQLSLQRENSGHGAIGGAILGGLVGAVESDDGDELGGLLVGATLGSAIGTAEEQGEVQDARDDIVKNCMVGRGHNVVG